MFTPEDRNDLQEILEEWRITRAPRWLVIPIFNSDTCFYELRDRDGQYAHHRSFMINVLGAKRADAYTYETDTHPRHEFVYAHELTLKGRMGGTRGWEAERLLFEEAKKRADIHKMRYNKRYYY